MKRNYDKRIRKANLRQDQLLLWHVPDQGVGTSKKLNRKWRGPYRVVFVDHPHVVLADRHGTHKKVHLNHVKPCKSSLDLAEFRSRGRPRILGGGAAMSGASGARRPSSTSDAATNDEGN